jgi:hypothetical protein
MEKALGKQLGRRRRRSTLNAGALKAGWDYAKRTSRSRIRSSSSR